MRWLELSVDADREAVEAVSEVFARHGHGGTVIEEPIVAEPGGDGYSIDLDAMVTVKAYLPDDSGAAAKRRRIAEALWHLGRLRPLGPLTVRPIAEDDWANAWKQHYHVQHFGRVVVKPSWQEYQPAPGELVVELDPGMAFGTGTHPTTRLCLEALESLVRPGSRVLDVGTGSGILAMAAAKLGAGSVLALDVDEVAVRVARDNIARAGLDQVVEVRLGSLDPTTCAEPFDLILANITARTIAGLAATMVGALTKSALLLLSGIIADQIELVEAALDAAAADIVLRRQSGDWLALTARRR